MKEDLGIADLMNILAGGEMPSELPNIGLGMGVSPMVKRWAVMGYILENSVARICLESGINTMKSIEAKRKFSDIFEENGQPKRGRPKKTPPERTDAFRAFQLWNLAKNLKELGYKLFSNRELIKILCNIEILLKIDEFEKTFPNSIARFATYEQSVSRGKEILEIDDNWESKVCEKIAAI